MTLEHIAFGDNRARPTAPAAPAGTSPRAGEQPRAQPAARQPTIIVLGNGKGGTGKSTAAMHIIVGLLRDGHRVGAIDLDAEQGTLARYFDNRRAYAARRGVALPQPLYRSVARSALADRRDAAAEECERLARAIDGLADCDFIVIDTPGADNSLSREGHFYADILLTPLNDSFVDLDQLGRIDPATHTARAMGRYADMVWAENNRRLAHGKPALEWIVMRNRVAALDSRNGRQMDRALAHLAENLGLRLVAGFSERVIFRELFLDGLTLLDIREDDSGVELTMSHMAALVEVRNLLRELNIGRILDADVKTCAGAADAPATDRTIEPSDDTRSAA